MTLGRRKLPITVRFICDCMCCGAAKCLRAWGYFAYWEYGIEDRTVLNMAVKNSMVIVTGDSGIFKRNLITSGRIKAVYVPVGLSRWEQFEKVLSEFSLPRMKPRCMKCGGELAGIDKEKHKEELPPRTYTWLEEFFRCRDCGRLFWKGTHWNKIEKKLGFYQNKLFMGEEGTI